MGEKNWKTVRTPAKRTFHYEVENDGTRFEFTSNYMPDTETGSRWIAEEAAQDFFHNHDGWEAIWPVEFTLFNDGQRLGCFTVDVEPQPIFHATLLSGI